MLAYYNEQMDPLEAIRLVNWPLAPSTYIHHSLSSTLGYMPYRWELREMDTHRPLPTKVGYPSIPRVSQHMHVVY